jgi:hypothetical protein
MFATPAGSAQGRLTRLDSCRLTVGSQPQRGSKPTPGYVPRSRERKLISLELHFSCQPLSSRRRVQASPRGMQSKSIQIAETYPSTLREQNPDLNIDVLSLWMWTCPRSTATRQPQKLT